MKLPFQLISAALALLTIHTTVANAQIDISGLPECIQLGIRNTTEKFNFEEAKQKDVCKKVFLGYMGTRKFNVWVHESLKPHARRDCKHNFTEIAQWQPWYKNLCGIEGDRTTSVRIDE